MELLLPSVSFLPSTSGTKRLALADPSLPFLSRRPKPRLVRLRETWKQATRDGTSVAKVLSISFAIGNGTNRFVRKDEASVSFSRSSSSSTEPKGLGTNRYERTTMFRTRREASVVARNNGMFRVFACDPRVQFERSPRAREKKHVVVTGAAGFVGFHAAQALRRRGDSVVGVDVFSSYYPTPLKRSRERKLKEIGVEVVEADVNDEEKMQELLDGKTHVLHLAAQPGVRYASRDAKSYVNANLGGFVSIMEASRKGKGSNEIPLVVYASSSSVYGDASRPPFREDEVACQPLSLYAATKRANELIAHVYSHTHGIKCTGLRFFTVYGPWGRPDMAVSSFTKKILKGETIRIFQGPNGSELGRDFTYIDDIVDGCLGAIDTAGTGQYRIYNLGNTQPITVTELVRTLETHLNKQAITKYVPLPDAGDVLFTHADISLAKKDLGYEPKVPFDEGIRRSVEWYLDYHGIDGTNATAEEWDYEPC